MAALSAKNSILNDSEILKYFIAFLESSEERISSKETSHSNKLLIKQVSLHILKSLSYLISTGGDSFLKELSDQGLLETFVAHLYKRQSGQQKQRDLIPVEWLEFKCTEIKKKALENDLSLVLTD